MDARTKGIEIEEPNRCNAQPLEKSESMEADNRVTDNQTNFKNQAWLQL